MQHRVFEPTDELRDTIESFWYLERNFGESESSFEVVPDGHAEIIFYFGSTCSVSVDGELQPLPSPFLTGLLDHPVHFYARNRLEIIGVKCFPWTVFDLLGLPPGSDGVRVFAHPIAQLQATLERAMRAGRVEEAVSHVCRYFSEARSGIAPDSLLFQAGVAMREANGTLPVSKIAASAHATVRTLERRFKQSSGYSMKEVSRLIRFEQVRNRLWRDPDANLAGLSQELGYTDQSHLSREFKRYTGTTPAAFARKAKQALQTVGNNIVAFIQS